jgi:uncharacterized protein (DUF1810 family)
MVDRFDLQRFVDAQAGAYQAALSELRAGRKRSHWMWFIFPQVAGLGHSAMAQRYAIKSRAEALAYLDHGVLGARLRECTNAVLSAPAGRTAHEIFGSPDDLKFCSSMTLFAAIGEDAAFSEAIERFYNGERDRRTLDILARQQD